MARPVAEPAAVLDYSHAAFHAPRPTPPLVHRCLRTALISSAAFCAVTGTWAIANCPRTTHWSFQKRLCAALLENASLVAVVTFALGLVWWLKTGWYRRSVPVTLALGSSLVMFVVFALCRPLT